MDVAVSAHQGPGAAPAAAGIARGREPAGGGGHSPPPRRAVCEQHKHGSVRGAPGNRGAHSMQAIRSNPELGSCGAPDVMFGS